MNTQSFTRLLLVFLVLSIHNSSVLTQRSTNAVPVRGSGATGRRSSTGRSGSVVNPDSGFSTSNGFSGGVSTLPKSTSGFANSIVKARDKISYSMKSIVRPKVKVPRPSVSRPVMPLFTPRTGYKGTTGKVLAAAGTSGFFLGRMIGRLSGQDYSRHYVPFRSRLSPQTQSTTPGTEKWKPKKDIDICMLHRWNQELPFAEIPNMAIDFLANNTISGRDFHTKAGYMFELFQMVLNSYGRIRKPGGMFVIPEAFDLSVCNFQTMEEPIEVAVKHVKGLYSNVSSEVETLHDLIEAVQACLPRDNETMPARLLPCLDYGITAEQLLTLPHPDSMFNNDDLCKEFLSPRLLNCQLRNCSVHHLLSINMFARNFYLCSESVHRDTVIILQDDAYLREYDHAFSSSMKKSGHAWILGIGTIGVIFIFPIYF